MTAYSASAEEALRARNLLTDWASEGIITEAQHQRMEQETLCEFRRTNIFLRLILFLFTLIIVGAGVGLVFAVFFSHPEPQLTGTFLLIFSAAAYAGAELAVANYRLYRYGIEEALAVCSVGFLCAGIDGAFFSRPPYSSTPNGAQFLVPAAGAIASLWIWRRFGLSYAAIAAMIFVVWMPGYFTPSHSAQRLTIVALYGTGLAAAMAVRPRHSLDYRNEGYSIVEGSLLFGIYLAINIQLSSPDLLGQWWRHGAWTTAEFQPTFYWATWAMTWFLPPVVLARGLHGKDRIVIGVGALAAVLTLVTNKPYLGWQRHTWDPMLLGILLAGVAIFARRWLAGAPGGVRHGFTAERLSAKDKRWLSAGSAAFGLAAPHLIPASRPSDGPAVQFGGGNSGGGGASSDF